jgi:hypothetical protein
MKKYITQKSAGLLFHTTKYFYKACEFAQTRANDTGLDQGVYREHNAVYPDEWIIYIDLPPEEFRGRLEPRHLQCEVFNCSDWVKRARLYAEQRAAYAAQKEPDPEPLDAQGRTRYQQELLLLRGAHARELVNAFKNRHHR